MDLTTARSFLEAYFPDLRDDEEIELRCIKHKHVEQLFGRDLDALLERAAALNERGYNCYFCPAIRRAGLRDGKASGISRTRWLWADLDFKDLDGDDKPGQARDTILGLRPWPQIVVASGGGLQAHYRLDADLDDPTWINHFLKELAVLLGSDPAVAKAPQPMRLPGFANHKYDHKPLAHWKPVRGAADHVRLEDFDWPEPEPDPPAPARAPYDGPPTEYEQLREALAHIPPKPVGAGYEEWTRILMGIHAAFPGADGLALAQEWDPRKAREIAQKWKTFEPVGYTVGSVFYAARQHGYVRPPLRPEILTGPKGSPPGDEASRRPGATSSGIWLEDYIASPPPPVEWVVGDLLPRGGSSLIVAREKTGKCLAKGTLVGMADGTLRAVETIRVGDLLMGPDSRPRRVLSLASGRDQMYLVKQNHGIHYRVNSEHILSLRNTDTGRIVNVGVRDYLASPNSFRSRHKGYKAAIDFPAQDLPLEPYFLGLWLGDGSEANATITNPEPEIRDYLEDYAARLGLKLHQHANTTLCPVLAITGEAGGQPTDRPQAILRRMGVLGHKHIPHQYITASAMQRSNLLAGLLDTDGHYDPRSNTYELTQTREDLARQIKYLADTLGLSTALRPKRATWTHNGESKETIAWRLTISGRTENLPLRVTRKQPRPRDGRWVRDNTGITVTPDGIDEYYGFTIDGDSLFLLEDMTVTHNSFYALNMGMAVAGGRPFLGHATTPGVVLFFSLDMPTRPLWPAINRLAPAWGVPPERFRLHDRKTDDALNAAPLERIAALIAEFHPALVIVDTLQKATGIKDPNNYSEVVETIDRLTDLAERADTHVCLLHHARKGGGDIFDAILGSVGFGGAVDTMIGLETDEEVGGLKMSLKGRWALYPPPAAIGIDEHTRQVFLIDANRDRAARAACEHQIVAYLAAHPEQKAPEREIKAALAHQEAHTITQALAALAAWARIEKAGDRWALPQHARAKTGPAQLVIAGAD